MPSGPEKGPISKKRFQSCGSVKQPQELQLGMGLRMRKGSETPRSLHAFPKDVKMEEKSGPAPRPEPEPEPARNHKHPLRFNFTMGRHTATEKSTAESSSTASRRERAGGVVPVWSPWASAESDQFVGNENVGAASSSYFAKASSVSSDSKLETAISDWVRTSNPSTLCSWIVLFFSEVGSVTRLRIPTRKFKKIYILLLSSATPAKWAEFV